MIDITPERTLKLTPRSGLNIKVPELELPLQFGFRCPLCRTIIYGAAEFPTEVTGPFSLGKYFETPVPSEGCTEHSYPQSYDSHMVILDSGVRGVVFSEEGHAVTGYDPFYSKPANATRCSINRMWYGLSGPPLVREVVAAIKLSGYLYIPDYVEVKLMHAITSDCSVAVKFLELLENHSTKPLYRQADECGNLPPIYLLKKDGLTSIVIQAIMKEAAELTNG